MAVPSPAGQALAHTAAHLSETDASALRARLIDQLAYLCDEIEALHPIIDRIPPEVQSGRPMSDDLSIKEIFGLIATINADIYLPALQQMIAEDNPTFSDTPTDTLMAEHNWNAQPMSAILDAIADARQSLVAFLTALPANEWQRTATFGDQLRDVYGVAHHITQQDVTYLSAIGYRLHASAWL